MPAEKDFICWSCVLETYEEVQYIMHLVVCAFIYAFQSSQSIMQIMYMICIDVSMFLDRGSEGFSPSLSLSLFVCCFGK